MSTISSELLSLTHSAIIELFEIDATPLGGAVHRFHNGANELRAPVVWRGVEYQYFPIEAEGFDLTADGPMPRPKVRVANVMGLVGVLNREYGNLLGAKFTRRRTLARFLDAANFAGGNPDADPTAGYPDDLWVVDRKAGQDHLMCEYELASPLDVGGVQLPRRQVIARICGVGYRSAECSYAGGAVADINDVPTTDMALDDCSGRLSGCLLRFGSDPDGIPFGGFLGVGQFRQV